MSAAAATHGGIAVLAVTVLAVTVLARAVLARHSHLILMPNIF